MGDKDILAEVTALFRRLHNQRIRTTEYNS